MPRLSRTRTSPPAAPAAGLSGDQAARLADLVADGRGEVPEGLPPADRERLLAAVRRRLRDRLVRLIARAVAWRLHRQATARPGDP